MSATQVLIVDDHALFRQGIRTVIEGTGNYQVVGEASNGEEALSLATHLRPDLILTDIHMSGESGMYAIRTIKSRLPQTKVIVLSAHDSREYLFEALKNGADGFLSKTTETNALISSLQAVMRGEVALPRRLATAVLREFSRLAQIETGYVTSHLTHRESQILFHISQGLTNAEIARVLHISQNTVKVHITNLFKKLRVENRVQAAAYAHQLDLAENLAN